MGKVCKYLMEFHEVEVSYYQLVFNIWREKN